MLPLLLGSAGLGAALGGLQAYQQSGGDWGKTFGGAADSGDLSVEDVASLFGKVEGFKASAPAVRKAAEEGAEEGSYDF